MERVTSREAFDARIAGCREQYGRLASNNYHYDPDIQDMIDRGTLYCLDGGGGLAFLHDMGNCYDLFYYLPKESAPAFDLGALDKPALISQVFSREDDRILRAAAFWQSQGFLPYKSSRHMVADVYAMPEPAVPVRFAETRADAERFAEIIRNSFYAYGDGVPDADEICEAISDRRVFTLTAMPEGVPAGYMRTAAPVGNHTDNQNISIDPRFRGRGYSRQIVLTVAAWCRERGVKTMTLWVNRGNTVAERLYETLGYQYTGKESRQYLLDPTKHQKEEQP